MFKNGQSPVIAGLLADREFVGDDWFNWLLTEGIPFCIRIKGNVITTNARGLEVGIDRLFYDLKPGEHRVIQNKRKLWKQQVYLSALRLTDGELLIVATDSLMPDPILHYAKRWEIETLFSCLKSRGFNFEDTPITILERIEKLLVLLTIAFCWAYKTGEWRHTQKAIKIKKHGRKAISYFRYGLDLLRDAALNGTQCISWFFIRYTWVSVHESNGMHGYMKWSNKKEKTCRSNSLPFILWQISVMGRSTLVSQVI